MFLSLKSHFDTELTGHARNRRETHLPNSLWSGPSSGAASRPTSSGTWSSRAHPRAAQKEKKRKIKSFLEHPRAAPRAWSRGSGLLFSLDQGGRRRFTRSVFYFCCESLSLRLRDRELSAVAKVDPPVLLARSGRQATRGLHFLGDRDG